MFLARVVGDVVATIKHPALANHKLLLVQPLTGDGTPKGARVIAVDAAQVLRQPRGPIRTVVVGVVDEVAAGPEP